MVWLFPSMFTGFLSFVVDKGVLTSRRRDDCKPKAGGNSRSYETQLDVVGFINA
jgi:hypothetical protein